MLEIVGFSNYFVDAQSALPMGVNIEYMFLVFTTDNGFDNFLHCFLSSRINSSSGARSAFPMGLAPRLWSVLVVDHRLKFSSSLFVEFLLKIIFLSGARLALLMGVGPESMFGYL
jgi:hypothetical protein